MNASPPTTPNGWVFNVLPGWPLDQFTHWPELEKAGNVLLPSSFTAIAHTEDRKDVIFLCFLVREGSVQLTTIMSPDGDVSSTLDVLRRAMPMEEWKRLSIVEMAKFLASVDPDELQRQNAADGFEDIRAGWPRAAQAWRERLGQNPSANITAAETAPLKRRRNRITREHLEKVAEVYRKADADGIPPTRAVQNAFDTTHSTAAKWVAAARRQGILRPAPGARGGEVGNSHS